MNDAEFLRAFDDCSLPNERFRHRDHLRLAWLRLRRDGAEAGSDAVRAGIRRYAAAHGAADRYHETLTTFYLRLVTHAIARRPEVDDFERFLVAFPLLLDTALPSRHWGAETMWSAQARAGWVEPDLLPLPPAR